MLSHLTTTMVRYRVKPPCAWITASTLVSSLQSVVGCAAAVAAAITDTMLLPIDVSFVQGVQLHVKHALLDSNQGSWMAMEEKSRLHFEGMRFLPLNNAA